MPRRPRPSAPRSTGASTLVSVGLVSLVVAFYVVFAWRRRWIADDGLIVLRTVRNLLAGNGPVFNVGERVEANTSTLWTYLITVLGWVPVSLEALAIGLSLVCSVLGLLLAVLAARRLAPAAAVLMPVGALVYVVLPPARDFATSGLETGLVLLWLGAISYLLLRRATARAVPDGAGTDGGATDDDTTDAAATSDGADGSTVASARSGSTAVGVRRPRVRTPRGELGLAFLAGLAPLVRPELALVGGLVILLQLLAPVGWGRRVALVVTAAVVPGAYEVFRLGYYGLPYPNTAVAKEASYSFYDQGWKYVLDLADPYHLFIGLGLLLLVGLAALVASRRARSGGAPTTGRAVVPWSLRPSVAVAVILVSGLLYVAYVIKVGGDFMHGRMLLPGLFLLLTPVMVVPAPAWRRSVAGALAVWVPSAAVAVWAFLALTGPGPAYGTDIGPAGIADERAFYTLRTGNPNPVTAADYQRYQYVQGLFPEFYASDAPSFWADYPGPGWLGVPAPDAAGRTVYFINMGMTSMNTGLDVSVEDNVGLVNPLAAHTVPLPGGRVGHSKLVAPEWMAAYKGVPATGPLRADVLADAQKALTCPRTQELIASYTAPLTLGRVVDNITGALSRASYRYPYEAKDAAAMCSAPTGG